MAYTIRLQDPQLTFVAEPGERVLEAALRQGVGLPYGCTQGKCGQCLARLLEGEVGFADDTDVVVGGGDAPPPEVLLCQALPRSDLLLDVSGVELAPPEILRELRCKVERLERLAHDVMRVWLRLPEVPRLHYHAGQYLDILRPGGERRSFSIANAPGSESRLELHIRRVPGGGFSHHVFEEMKVGELLKIDAPLGSFYLRAESERPMVMVGGGTGFAPLKGLVEEAIQLGNGRPLHLYWGVRARRDLYLADLPERWMEEHPWFRFTPVLSEPSADDAWQGRTGWVHEAVVEDYADLSGVDLYVCGPPVMIEAAREAFLARGLPEERLFSDAFEYNSQQARRKAG